MKGSGLSERPWGYRFPILLANAPLLASKFESALPLTSTTPLRSLSRVPDCMRVASHGEENCKSASFLRAGMETRFRNTCGGWSSREWSTIEQPRKRVFFVAGMARQNAFPAN